MAGGRVGDTTEKSFLSHLKSQIYVNSSLEIPHRMKAINNFLYIMVITAKAQSTDLPTVANSSNTLEAWGTEKSKIFGNKTWKNDRKLP